jgi:DNA-binding winged helix-turn-helix (wHTH) protein
MPFSGRKDFPSSSPRSQRIAFDNFEVDSRSGEVRKNGARIRLQAQPFQLLGLLLENVGEIVTREEICRELWPADTFVDFEHSLAAAVNKIREALGDSAENPKYIETLPKRGYRFIGKIKPEAPVVLPPLESKDGPVIAAVPTPTVTHWGRWVAVFALLLIIVATFSLTRLPRNAENPEPSTAVPFTSYPGQATAPSVSPDGSRIAFSFGQRDDERLRFGRIRPLHESARQRDPNAPDQPPLGMDQFHVVAGRNTNRISSIGRC